MNISSLAGHVLELIELIDSSSKPADKLVQEFVRERKYLGSRDRRAITESTFGVLRNRRYIEAVFEYFQQRHPQYDQLNASKVRYVPLLAIEYKLIERFDDTAVLQALDSKWHALFPSCALPFFLEFVAASGDLNYLPRDTPQDAAIALAVKHSFQDWMVELWREQFGMELEKLLMALNTPGETTLRVNFRVASREEIAVRLAKEGIETKPAKYSPHGLIAVKRFNRHSSPSFTEGLFEIQDEGSQIVSLLTGAKSGMLVVDACAGAGGKSLHLAQIMNDKGNIVAIDVDEKKLFELQERAKRAHVSIVHPLIKNRTRDDELISKADIVLVDAPCSGSGTIRRNPGTKWKLTESQLEHFHGLQLRILENAATYVKLGGSLVYSTCSLFKRENEDVVGEFLRSNPGFSHSPLADADLISALGSAAGASSLALLPHIHNTDGFYIARLSRRTS
jgi:16S rRNA (cytosine967-C5)-methyltransferase